MMLTGSANDFKSWRARRGTPRPIIRAWLGHVSLETTCRYAEITLRGKMAAVAACLPPVTTSIPYDHAEVTDGAKMRNC